MKQRQFGFTLIELMGGLLIGSMLLVGLGAMINSSMSNTKAQQTALQQSQAADAARKFMANQYSALLSATSGGTTRAVPFSTSVSPPLTQPITDFLPPNFSVSVHPYNKTFCLLVRQRPPLPSTKLDALLITEGGADQVVSGKLNPHAIPFTDLAYIAANSGQGGGYISGAPLGNLGGTLEARGAYSSWRVDGSTIPTLANFTSANCGTAVKAGQLATAIFYEGPGQYTTDFLYRNAVPNRPDLNTMTTPIAMGAGTAAQVKEDDPCPSGTLTGTIAVSNTASADGIGGRVLSCRSGTWQRQGNLFWRNPVAQYSDLASLTNAALRATIDPLDPRPNATGDVRMVKTPPSLFTGPGNTTVAKQQPPRPYSWDGTTWQALSSDQYGVLTTPEIQISRNNVKKGDNCNIGSPAGAPSVPVGRLATDENGLVLSCQYKDAATNVWSTLSTLQVGDTEPPKTWIILWNDSLPAGVPWDSPTPGNTAWWPHGWITYYPANDWYSAVMSRTVVPTRDGVVVANATANMSRQLWNDPSLMAQIQIQLQLYDKDTGQLVGSTDSMPNPFSNAAAVASVTLSKAVPKNTNGYELKILTNWCLYIYPTPGYPASGIYNRANYQNTTGTWVEKTPLHTTWNMDLFY